MKQELDAAYVHYVLKDNLLVATYKRGLHIDLDMARKIVQTRQQFTKHQLLRVLILDRGVVSMNKEAREYLASPEGTDKIRAAAIVLDSVFGAFLGNFFLRVNKPGMPARIFKHKSKALNWLKKLED